MIRYIKLTVLFGESFLGSWFFYLSTIQSLLPFLHLFFSLFLAYNFAFFHFLKARVDLFQQDQPLKQLIHGEFFRKGPDGFQYFSSRPTGRGLWCPASKAFRRVCLRRGRCGWQDAERGLQRPGLVLHFWFPHQKQKPAPFRAQAVVFISDPGRISRPSSVTGCGIGGEVQKNSTALLR